ncbi:hypothetical protein K438DRAFT_1983577 [Mycena galopus ATCC 62051]|nr:hypothetical protein K438DRAFT_1983577 [Mycena galopus ATCC 62051]
MRSLNRPLLDSDIIDRLMTLCSTCDALQSLILVSKAFYIVFQTHAKSGLVTSITWAVAYNLVGPGPALPEAPPAERYPYDQCNTQYDDAATIASLCPEDRDPSVLAADEKEKLHVNSRVVAALEDVYNFMPALTPYPLAHLTLAQE